MEFFQVNRANTKSSFFQKEMSVFYSGFKILMLASTVKVGSYTACRTIYSLLFNFLSLKFQLRMGRVLFSFLFQSPN
jgi:hypothetical protein